MTVKELPNKAVERCLACEAERGRHPPDLRCHNIERGYKWARVTMGLVITHFCGCLSGPITPRCRPLSASQARQRSTGCNPICLPLRSLSVITFAALRLCVRFFLAFLLCFLRLPPPPSLWRDKFSRLLKFSHDRPSLPEPDLSFVICHLSSTLRHLT